MNKLLQLMFLSVFIAVLSGCVTVPTSSTKSAKNKNSQNVSEIDINRYASIDDKIIEEVRSNETHNRYVIPSELYLESIAMSIKFNSDQGRVIFRENNGEFVIKVDKGNTMYITKNNSMEETSYLTNVVYQPKKPPKLVDPNVVIQKKLKSVIFPGGDGTVFMFQGKVNNFTGDYKDPLRFVYLKSAGLVYLGGTGKVTDVNGAVIFDSSIIGKSKK